MKFSQLSKIERVNENSRSIAARFGFARVRACASRPCVTGEGSMAEVLTRIAGCRAREDALDLVDRRPTALTNIGRSLHNPWRAVKGGQGFYFLSGLVPGASRLPLRCRGARPSFARRGAGPRGAVAEPRCARGALSALARPRRAILGAGGEIPMSQIAPAVGTSPARRLRRLVAGGCGSIRFIPIAFFTCQVPSGRGNPDRSPSGAAPPLRAIRLASRASSVADQVGPQQVPPTNIEITWDGLVAHRVSAAFPARGACPARGKLKPAVVERTPEAQLTTAAFPARGACPARGTLNAARRAITLEAQLTTATFPARGALPARGKLKPAVVERTPEAQLAICCATARGKLATVLGRTHRRRSDLTAFSAPRLSDRVAEARVESPAEPTKRVEGVVESDVRRLTGPPDQITRKLQCAGPARRQAAQSPKLRLAGPLRGLPASRTSGLLWPRTAGHKALTRHKAAIGTSAA
jgi:hypothetical protein